MICIAGCTSFGIWHAMFSYWTVNFKHIILSATKTVDVLVKTGFNSNYEVEWQIFKLSWRSLNIGKILNSGLFTFFHLGICSAT